MLTWHTTPIPDPVNNHLVQVLAIHVSNRYTSDVYMVWKDQQGTIARWPHTDKPITHWAYYNIPSLD